MNALFNNKKIPLRKCIACGARKPKSEFTAIVRPPKRALNSTLEVMAGDAKKEGRGAYLCKNKSCYEKALKSRRLEKTFKRKIEAEIYSSLQKAVTMHE